MVKGCKFHWAQQVKRLSKAVTKCADDRQEIKDELIPLFDSRSSTHVDATMAWVLHKWPISEPWVKWWQRLNITKMAFRSHTDNKYWDRLPYTNNIADSHIVRDNTNRAYSNVVENLWDADFAAFLVLAASEQGMEWNLPSSTCEE